ncbi:STAS domain-containing protein [Streptomyces sp. NPDC102409]|uniref:STAS domain-containing protein n=1 Tax=Streptomyces sp. NPDC102409 TaxID=3366172 RepID=UPI0037F83A39
MSGEDLPLAIALVVAEGDLDVESARPLQERLERAAADHDAIVLEASGVTFADSSFLNLLLRTTQAAPLRIAAASAPVRRLLEVTGADQVLRVHPDVDAAREALSRE